MMKEVFKLPVSGRFGYLLASQRTSIINCVLFQCSYSLSMNFTLQVVLTLFRELLARVVIGLYGPSCPFRRATKETKSFAVFKSCTGKSRYCYT